MNPFVEYLQSGHWLAFLMLMLGLLPLAGAVWRRWRGHPWSLPMLLTGSALSLLGLGGFEFISANVGLFAAAVIASFLVTMLVVVIVTGLWWAPLGYGLGALLLIALGAGVVPALGRVLQEFGTFLASLET